MAIAKAGLKLPISGKKVNTSSSVIRMLLEKWVNDDPEMNIYALYRGGYSLQVSGYSLQWDKEDVEGIKPEYIQLSKYIQKPIEEEVVMVRDTITGELRIKSKGYADEYFTGELPDVDDITGEEEECEEEDVRVYPIRNIETGVVRYGSTGASVGEEILKVLINHDTGETREVKQTEYCKDGEEETELYVDSTGEVYLREYDDPVDIPTPTRTPIISVDPDFVAIKGSEILRCDK